MGYAGEKLQFKDAANLRELTFVGLFWIEVPAQLALPRPRPAEWLALEEPADALAPPPAAALAPPPAEALAPPPAEALALASPRQRIVSALKIGNGKCWKLQPVTRN